METAALVVTNIQNSMKVFHGHSDSAEKKSEEEGGPAQRQPAGVCLARGGGAGESGLRHRDTD